MFKSIRYLCGTPKRLRSTSHRKPRRLEYESLERREMMAGDMFRDIVVPWQVQHNLIGPVSFDSTTGVLSIDGTNGHDTASVRDQNEQINVTFNGVSYAFEKWGLALNCRLGRQCMFSTNVKSIQFSGHQGNDRFENHTDIPSVAYGHAGDDYLQGGLRGDRLFGGGNNDQLFGGGTDDRRDTDYMEGGPGNDRLWGGPGRDVLSGQDGIDRILGENGDDEIWGDAGEDELIGGSGGDRIHGGADRDRIYGDGGEDFLWGDGGNDDMYGGSSRDYLWGGDDNDSLFGEFDDDYLFGENGNDWLYGNEGADAIYGGEGNDTLVGQQGKIRWGADGDDALYGEDGDDRLFGDDGNDYLSGGDGNDELHGEAGADFLSGGDGNDSLYGGPDTDQLYGDNGNDGLFGGINDLSEVLFGGSGADRFLVLTVDGTDDSGPWFEDFAMDLSAEDARLRFTSDGQPIWVAQQIELADRGFAFLHAHVNNTRLLKHPDGRELSFQRVVWLGGNTVGDNDHNGRIRVDDRGAWSSQLDELMVHELAHNWQFASGLWDRWLPLSGWRRLNVVEEMAGFDPQPGLSADGHWWYNVGAQFARDYGKTNPKEDWATSWEVYYKQMSNPNDSAARDNFVRMSNKMAVLAGFFQSVRT
jgi:Ca2+-binding RTX toxin-like protein